MGSQKYLVFAIILLFCIPSLGSIHCNRFVQAQSLEIVVPPPSRPAAPPARVIQEGGGVASWIPRNWRLNLPQIRSAQLPRISMPRLRSLPGAKQFQSDKALVLAEIQRPLDRDPDYIRARVIPYFETLTEGKLPENVEFSRDYEVVIFRAEDIITTDLQAPISFEIYAAVPVHQNIPRMSFRSEFLGQRDVDLEGKATQIFFFHPVEAMIKYNIKELAPVTKWVKTEMIHDDGVRVNYYKADLIFQRNSSLQLPQQTMRPVVESNEGFSFGPKGFDRHEKDGFSSDFATHATSRDFVQETIYQGRHAFWPDQITFDVIPLMEISRAASQYEITATQGSHTFVAETRSDPGPLETTKVMAGRSEPNGYFLNVTPIQNKSNSGGTRVDQDFLQMRGVVLDRLSIETGYELDTRYFQSFQEHGFDLFRFVNNVGDYRYFFVSHRKSKVRTYDGDRGFGTVTFLDLKGKTLELEITSGETLVLQKSYAESNGVSLYFQAERSLLDVIHERVQKFEADGGYQTWELGRVPRTEEGEVYLGFNRSLDEAFGELLLGEPNPSRTSELLRELGSLISRAGELTTQFEVISSNKEVTELLRSLYHKSKEQNLENLRESIEALDRFLTYRVHILMQSLQVFRLLEKELGEKYDSIRTTVADRVDPAIQGVELRTLEDTLGYFLFGNGEVSPVEIHIGRVGKLIERNREMLSVVEKLNMTLTAHRDRPDIHTSIQIWESIQKIMAPPSP